MITVGVIRNGATYLSHHLRKNDYWSEGEQKVQGEWIGQGAAMLGLSGLVTDKPFEALRQNRHPQTGETLTACNRPNRVAFFDIQLSAPKDVSVLAMVGNDERVRTAFADAVKVTLAEMERFAAVRERRGDQKGTEAYRLTGNFVGALFLHDASRDLDPQLHSHAVLANATWDAARHEWFALQPAEMLRASPYLRQVLYRELAGRLHSLGYEPYDMNKNGFSIRGVEHLRERFSKRAKQVQQLAEKFAAEKGRKPTKRETEILVRESRANKLTEISTAAVRAKQRAQLNRDEVRMLDQLVQRAKRSALRPQISHGVARTVLEAAMRHGYERTSVMREGQLLASALELYPHFYGWRELRQALKEHPDVITREGEITLRHIWNEERATVERIRDGRNQCLALGPAVDLPAALTVGQRKSAETLLASRDFVAVLIGDAGTGKTTVLTAIETAHVAGGGKIFVALAPTTRARDAMVQSGFAQADTVQRFLVSDPMQAQAISRTILVDEAGLLSTQQLNQLIQIAHKIRARVVLVGDTKQHYSVQRGDALRNVVRHAGIFPVRLSEVLRQRSAADRRFSSLLASASFVEAVEYADRHGLVRETHDDNATFVRAAEHYAENRKRGIETLVVIPLWEEIDRFNGAVRPALRNIGLLGHEEVVRPAVRPLSWTEEQKRHWSQYRVGDTLLFARDTRFFKRGMAADVTEILMDGIRVKTPDGREGVIRAKQRTAFDVGRRELVPLAEGDRLLIRGRYDEAGFANGDFREVVFVDPPNDRVLLSDGEELPREFTAWTYGHALTSYRSQGSTTEESLFVLGERGARALARRQFYVGNTRYRGAHTIYSSDKDLLLDRLAQPEVRRELATEFVRRQGIVEQESVRAENRMRAVWENARKRLRRIQEQVGIRRSA